MQRHPKTSFEVEVVGDGGEHPGRNVKTRVEGHGEAHDTTEKNVVAEYEAGDERTEGFLTVGTDVRGRPSQLSNWILIGMMPHMDFVEISDDPKSRRPACVG